MGLAWDTVEPTPSAKAAVDPGPGSAAWMTSAVVPQANRAGDRTLNRFEEFFRAPLQIDVGRREMLPKHVEAAAYQRNAVCPHIRMHFDDKQQRLARGASGRFGARQS